MIVRLLAVSAVVLAFATGTISAAQSSEGIKVRGHWTIEVLNPDGTVAQRREFDNHLQVGPWGQPIGASTLTGILTGRFSPGPWRIQLGNLASSSWSGGPCAGVCVLGTERDPVSNAPRHGLLTVEGGFRLVLKGSVTATTDADINQVMTNVYTCSSEVPPSRCSGTETPQVQMDLWGVTATSVPLLKIVTDQIIQIKVEISFTSAAAATPQ